MFVSLFIIFVLFSVIFSFAYQFPNNFAKYLQFVGGNLAQFAKSYQMFGNRDVCCLYECGERLNINKNIDKDDIVLEIGGNRGITSKLIASKLSNSNNLLVIEPSVNAYKKLEVVGNQIGFQSFNGCLSSVPLYMKKEENPIMGKLHELADYVVVSSVKSDDVIPVLTYGELKETYNLEFNTLVMDCEGCYKEIFNDFPEIFDDIKKILIEWDGEYMHDFLLEKGYRCIDEYYNPVFINGTKTYVK